MILSMAQESYTLMGFLSGYQTERNTPFPPKHTHLLPLRILLDCAKENEVSLHYITPSFKRMLFSQFHVLFFGL